MSERVLQFGAASSDTTLGVDVETLLRTRLLVQANSGGGKSHLLRALLEQTHGRVQQLVLDPEGEFATLRERFPYVLAGREGDVATHVRTAKQLAQRLMEVGASAIIDLYDLSLTDRREYVRVFITALMAVPRAHWRPLLVVIDEAHNFAPERGSGDAQSTDAVIALCTQGRKRGFCAVLATQRISKLHKDAAAELLNKLIGRTGLDVDMRRAGDELGMDRDARMALRDLAPGSFFAYGAAFGGGVTRCRAPSVVTSHPSASSVGAAPPPATPDIRALVAKLGDLPALAEAEVSHVATLERTVTQLQAQLKARQATPHPDIERERLFHDGYLEGRVAADARLAAIAVHLATMGETVRGQWEALGHLLVTPPRAAGNGTGTGPTLTAADGTRPVLGALTAASPAIRASPASIPATDATGANDETDANPGGLPRAQQAILDALADMAVLGLVPLSRSQVAFLAGQSPTSSSFHKHRAALAERGLIEQDGPRMALSSAGLHRARFPDRPKTLEAYHARWLRDLTAPQQRMVVALLSTHPQPIPRAHLAALSDQSPTSSSFHKNRAALALLHLTHDTAGRVSLTPVLFPRALVE